VNIGQAIVKIGADPTSLVRTLRIMAKHANACADELEAEVNKVEDDE
jgi:hypothetical protein